MTFAIGKTEYYQSLGFDTTHWRKSMDGTQAVVHYDFVKPMASDERLTFYRHDDADFSALLASEAWSEQEPAE